MRGISVSMQIFVYDCHIFVWSPDNAPTYKSPEQYVLYLYTEAEPKEKHVVWDPMPELTITSPFVHSRVEYNTFTMVNPMPESTLKVHKHEIFCVTFFAEIETIWSQGPVTRDF